MAGSLHGILISIDGTTNLFLCQRICIATCSVDIKHRTLNIREYKNLLHLFAYKYFSENVIIIGPLHRGSIEPSWETKSSVTRVTCHVSRLAIVPATGAGYRGYLILTRRLGSLYITTWILSYQWPSQTPAITNMVISVLFVMCLICKREKIFCCVR